MFFLLIGVLLSFSIFLYHKDRDILDLSFIVTSTFFVCVCLDLLYVEIWNLPLHFITVLAICWGIFAFHIGSYFSKYFLAKRTLSMIGASPVKLIEIKTLYFWGFIILDVLFLVFNVQEFYSISSKLTDSSSLGEQIRVVIKSLQFKEVAFCRWYAYRQVYINSLTYISLFIWVFNGILRGKLSLKEGILLLPVVIYCVSIIYTGGRQGFIYLAIYGLVIYNGTMN